MKENKGKDKIKISDNPSTKKVKEDYSMLGGLVGLYKIVRFFGLRSDTFDQIAEQYDEQAKQLKELVQTIDNFNPVFLEHGWISHESMNVPVAQEALRLYEESGLEIAEEVLVNQFTREKLNFIVLWFSPVREFDCRKELAELAIDDYLAGRYHAVIPVQIMIIDGLVNDINKNKGFFAEGVEMDAWDSIAGHSDGLSKLAEVFRASRTVTRSEPLRIPYRNGIMHGRDLGYANQLVSAKLWGALQAICDYARAKQTEGRRKLESPKLLSEMTLEERKQANIESFQYFKAHTKWKARDENKLRKIPQSGVAKNYEEGSAERALVDFLLAWQSGNYGKVTELFFPLDKLESFGKRVGNVRRDFEDYKLKGFKVLEVQDSTSTFSKINTEVTLEYDEETRIVPHTFFIKHCKSDWSSVPVGFPGGRWIVDYLVSPIHIFKRQTPFAKSEDDIAT